MIPVVTPTEMGAIDAAAPEPVAVLVERAGEATFRAALGLLGGTYGRRVVVVAGKGNNGADGRSAARRLRRRGVRVVELDATDLPDELPEADLLVDAGFGTGFRGEWTPPPVPSGTPVLAVDIPSGVDGLTGEAHGRPWAAALTVTFAALKPGLLLADGPSLAGEVVVADIGLDTSTARAHVVEPADVAGWLPERARAAHKWQAAVWIVAGSPGMTGAAHLSAAGAQRAGAGYVRLSTPGLERDPGAPTEVVGIDLPEAGWADAVLADVDRVAALGVGPGLGRGDAAAAAVLALVAAAPGRPPLVVDGDGLAALAEAPGDRADGPPLVLTPHDGELSRLGGDPGAPDRIAEVRALAARRRATVLAKGPTTVVAAPDGRVLLATAGDARLATAGTGDVLTGVLTALLAQGVAPLEAAAAAAHLHGRAGALAWRRGLVASDVAAHLPAALAELPPGDDHPPKD
ncbi:NAD(P)H-hydrate dehydratase [Iamia sp. SCSIO 61187]|uniref:NAD(P)H-hydrate dehydratase n=1 Tax=Iamia sp. SCSIO 61187 TaxID=2722752 RepID=UPI001C633F8E|nr:NAD(P)H-hydrate dehydratase [Iamia sp. SCSIO 61187]QYG91559.1 NAD(P)H-hydrate dehydratase [Iamia sp. SCSIO 61187]